MENLLKLSQFSNGELTKLRRRQQRQRQKAIVLVSKKTTLHVYHAFLYIPLPSLRTSLFALGYGPSLQLQQKFPFFK